MTDKEKIKEEIERQIEFGKTKCQQSKENNDRESLVAWSEHIATCGKILQFVDSLPEEHIDKTMKENYNERYKRIAQTEQFKKSYCNKSIGKEEPVSEDLERELERFAYSLPHAACGFSPKETDCKSVEARLKFGVEHTWSYEQVRKIARHFAEWQKQQMMKDAVDW